MKKLFFAILFVNLSFAQNIWKLVGTTILPYNSTYLTAMRLATNTPAAAGAIKYSSGTVYFYNGSSWVALGGSSGAGSFTKQQIDTVGTVVLGIWNATRIDSTYLGGINTVTAKTMLTATRYNSYDIQMSADTLTRNLSFSTDNDRIRDSVTWVALAGTKLAIVDTPKVAVGYGLDLSQVSHTATITADTTNELATLYDVSQKSGITDSTIVASGYGWNATQSGHTVTGSADTAIVLNKAGTQVISGKKYLTDTTFHLQDVVIKHTGATQLTVASTSDNAPVFLLSRNNTAYANSQYIDASGAFTIDNLTSSVIKIGTDSAVTIGKTEHVGAGKLYATQYTSASLGVGFFTSSANALWIQNTAGSNYIIHYTGSDIYKIGFNTSQTAPASSTLQLTPSLLTLAVPISMASQTITSGQITAEVNNADQIIAQGYDYVGGANTANGSIRLGRLDASNTYSRIYNDATGASQVDLYIDNAYNNAGTRTLFRMRTSGTPINALILDGAGAATFASTINSGAVTSSGLSSFADNGGTATIPSGSIAKVYVAGLTTATGKAVVSYNSSTFFTQDTIPISWVQANDTLGILAKYNKVVNYFIGEK